jgi:hypothetical protein
MNQDLFRFSNPIWAERIECQHRTRSPLVVRLLRELNLVHRANPKTAFLTIVIGRKEASTSNPPGLASPSNRPASCPLSKSLFRSDSQIHSRSSP